jgi:hypothetical protein
VPEIASLAEEPRQAGAGRRTTTGYPNIPGQSPMRMTDPIPKIAVHEPTGIGSSDFF